MINLFGRFKAETGYRWHCLPLCENGRSGIPFRAWIGTLLGRRISQGGRYQGSYQGLRGRIQEVNGPTLVRLILRFSPGEQSLSGTV
ncbi:hypothetical protein ACHAXM_003482 [Skeletonema potamos]